MKEYDVIILGAGAAGLMCAKEAGARGRKVLILEKSNKIGKKILMSGGGRCNFTNLNISPEKYISHNKHFCKSALSRYTQWDFIQLVEKHSIKYYEKTAGQLFCVQKSVEIVNMLLQEIAQHEITCELNQTIHSIVKSGNHFLIKSGAKTYRSTSLVVATGGLSIPTLGSSPFGYQLAAQFGLDVYPTRAGLVPITLQPEEKERLLALAGVSVEALVTCNDQSFKENILFTHRGLSGPAILQISSYWNPGDLIEITLLPELNLYETLCKAKKEFPGLSVKNYLAQFVAKSILQIFLSSELLEKPLKQLEVAHLRLVTQTLQAWKIKPNATEGYRTAEVTLGGVNCDEISSQTFEAKQIRGLYFVGEVLDVTGWLGGYNFQWAWSSGWAAGQVA
jgi:predicted Rossmann fold flavoprotein